MELESSSLSLPLHEGLIVPADREEVGVVEGELHFHDVLGVASQRDGLVSSSAGVSENVHESVVVTSGDEGLVLGEVNTVDVGAVGAGGEDAVNEPSVLGVAGGPDGVDGV